MSDLAEFLLARIADDEERARKRLHHAQQNDLTVRDPKHLGQFMPGWWEWREIETFASHVLAEVEAKRRILEMHKPYRRIYGLGCDVCLHPRRLTVDVDGWPCPTLRLLALPYADHPDYRQEWMP
ncbi:MAG TPA: DUF6221 family protein [Acidimicrobiales bacterium]|nr:DUF6221 family protein [Acidimicrobiales bacterium]